MVGTGEVFTAEDIEVDDDEDEAEFVDVEVRVVVLSIVVVLLALMASVFVVVSSVEFPEKEKAIAVRLEVPEVVVVLVIVVAADVAVPLVRSLAAHTIAKTRRGRKLRQIRRAIMLCYYSMHTIDDGLERKISSNYTKQIYL